MPYYPRQGKLGPVVEVDSPEQAERIRELYPFEKFTFVPSSNAVLTRYGHIMPQGIGAVPLSFTKGKPGPLVWVRNTGVLREIEDRWPGLTYNVVVGKWRGMEDASVF